MNLKENVSEGLRSIKGNMLRTVLTALIIAIGAYQIFPKKLNEQYHRIESHFLKNLNDRENKKMTIKHGDIKSLDMPGMTMVFQIRDTSLLETFKAGDKVKFVIEKLDGAFVVTSMQLAN